MICDIEKFILSVASITIAIAWTDVIKELIQVVAPSKSSEVYLKFLFGILITIIILVVFYVFICYKNKIEPNNPEIYNENH